MDRYPWKTAWHPAGEGEKVIETPRQAEEIATVWVRRFGFPDAEVTPPGPDYGNDVYSHGAVAQVKHWASGNARLADVQRIAGSAVRGQQAIFFSTSSYTESALTWAKQPECDTALFELRLDGRIRAVNTPAIRLLQETPYRGPERVRSSRSMITGHLTLLYELLLTVILCGMSAAILSMMISGGLGFGALVLLVPLITSSALMPFVIWQHYRIFIRPQLRFSSRKGWRKLLDNVPLYPPARKSDQASVPYQFDGVFRPRRDESLELRMLPIFIEEIKRRRNVRFLREYRPHDCPNGPAPHARYLLPGRATCGCMTKAIDNLFDQLGIAPDRKRGRFARRRRAQI